jgi:hypothetical protein
MNPKDQTTLIPNRKFRETYRFLFLKDPITANLFLLLCELGVPDGKVILPVDPEEADRGLKDLMAVRFEDPYGWQLGEEANE